MSHACHRFWQCHKTLRFCSPLTRCKNLCACHAKRDLNVKKWSEHVVFLTCLLRNVLRATTACTFSTSQLPKVLRTHQFLHFWLRNVLRATTACTFSTSQLPKVLRTRQFLTLLTSKCASRHNGVQFFISHLASWLRTRRFSEPTFRPSGATNHWQNISRLSYFFAHLSCAVVLVQLWKVAVMPALNFFRGHGLQIRLNPTFSITIQIYTILFIYFYISYMTLNTQNMKQAQTAA